MSHLDEMRAFLTRTGVVFTEGPEVRETEEAKALVLQASGLEVGDERTAMVKRAHGMWESTGRVLITVDSDGGPKNAGFVEFHTTLVFDADGTLESWGTWE